jgi:four helix bundle protein
MSLSFRDLRVWQDAMKLASETYRVTANFPRHELYGLSHQMRRAAVSVPSNIAEGKGHRSDKGFANFLFHARGSLLELETQIEIAQELRYLQGEQAQQLFQRTRTVGKSLTGLINCLSKPEPQSQLQSAKCFAAARRPTTEDHRPPATD